MTTSDRYWFTAVGAVLIIGGAADVWRDRCKDDTTLSCGVRRLVARVPGGRFMLAAGLTVAGIGFFDHIVGPLAEAAAQTLQEANRG